LLSCFFIYLFSLLLKIIGGSFAKKFGGKNVLTFAVFLWSLLTFLTPLFAYSVPTLIISRILLGIAEGVGLPAVVQIFSTCVLVDERSRAFGYLVGFGSVGQTVAAIVNKYNFKIFFQIYYINILDMSSFKMAMDVHNFWFYGFHVGICLDLFI
jgi:MFS family permease